MDFRKKNFLEIKWVKKCTWTSHAKAERPMAASCAWRAVQGDSSAGFQVNGSFTEMALEGRWGQNAKSPEFK